jgi:hypothetical protein
LRAAERERERVGPAGVGRKREKGERRGKRIYFLKNFFQIIFKLSNFGQTRNHAFEL